MTDTPVMSTTGDISIQNVKEISPLHFVSVKMEKQIASYLAMTTLLCNSRVNNGIKLRSVKKITNEA